MDLTCATDFYAPTFLPVSMKWMIQSDPFSSHDEGLEDIMEMTSDRGSPYSRLASVCLWVKPGAPGFINR